MPSMASFAVASSAPLAPKARPQIALLKSLDSIPSIPKAQRRVWVPTKELVLDFLDSFDEGFFWGLRDKLIASVLIECGPRNGELCNLRVQDVISTGHIRLNSKEKEERLAPI